MKFFKIVLFNSVQKLILKNIIAIFKKFINIFLKIFTKTIIFLIISLKQEFSKKCLEY